MTSEDGSDQRFEVGVSRQPQIDPFEPRGRLQHKRRYSVPPVTRKHDLAQQNVQLRLIQVVQRTPLSDGCEPRGRVESTGEMLCLRGAESAPSAAPRLDRQSYGPLQKRPR